jgi:hypothetical protein
MAMPALKTFYRNGLTPRYKTNRQRFPRRRIEFQAALLGQPLYAIGRGLVQRRRTCRAAICVVECWP